MNKLYDEQIHTKGVAHAMTVMARKMINNGNVIVNAFHYFMQDTNGRKELKYKSFLFDCVCHQPNNYKDTKP
jgi:hypothetical protein